MKRKNFNNKDFKNVARHICSHQRPTFSHTTEDFTKSEDRILHSYTFNNKVLALVTINKINKGCGFLFTQEFVDNHNKFLLSFVKDIKKLRLEINMPQLWTVVDADFKSAGRLVEVLGFTIKHRDIEHLNKKWNVYISVLGDK
jgi:hypothetical protein